MKLSNGPKTPAFWQTLQWVFNPLESMDTCFQRYGDMFTFYVGKKTPCVFLAHPQAVKQVFTADVDQFDSGSSNQIVKPLMGENSLLLMDGATHRRMRHLLTPPFHSEQVRTYGQLISDIADQVTNQLLIGKTFSVREVMQEISLQVIVQTIFGLYEGDRYQKLISLLSSMLEGTSSVWKSSFLFFKILQQNLGLWGPGDNSCT